MPGKKRILRNDILDAAVRVIQQSDTGTLTMRTLAKELGCSTQPIYYEFQNQEKLTEELLLYIKHKYLKARCSSYRDYAWVFLTFAEKEKQLFRFLYLRPRSAESKLLEDENQQQTIEFLVSTLEMEKQQAEEMHQRMQYYCYGLGTMIATGYRRMSVHEIDKELTDFFCILLRSYKHLSDEAKINYWLKRSRHLVE